MSGTVILPDFAGASIFQGSLNLKRKITPYSNYFVMQQNNNYSFNLLLEKSDRLHSCSIFAAEIIVYNRFMIKDQIRQVIPVEYPGLQGIIQALGRADSGSNEHC